MAATPQHRTQNVTTGLTTAATAVGTTGALVGAIGTSAAAVNAVPIAGQVASAALAIAAGLTALFAGKGPAGRRRKRQDAAKQFMQQRRETLASYKPAEPQQLTAAAPETQGMGQFQQMQQGMQPPIYSSGEPQQQPQGNF